MRILIIGMAIILGGCLTPQHPTPETIRTATEICFAHDGWDFVKGNFVVCHDGSFIKFKNNP